MKCTTVIATYNRQHCIERAVLSALATFPLGEVIVVDDASQDNTVSYLNERFATEIMDGHLLILEMPLNVGVTGAKNAGYAQAKGDWVIFLDSDDEFIQQAGRAMEEQLMVSTTRPIVFFRCRDHQGKFVGECEGIEVELGLKNYLKHTSFGEALTAVNKRLIGKNQPYPTDLRGYEGLGCCRLIQEFGPALLSKTDGRIYYTDGTDRLSLSRGLLSRMPLLAKGHWVMAKEFWAELDFTKVVGYLVKAFIYMVLGYSYRLVRGVTR
jgi:glycosyltransferase involved in cell wall biosynthesis